MRKRGKNRRTQTASNKPTPRAAPTPAAITKAKVTATPEPAAAITTPLPFDEPIKTKPTITKRREFINNALLILAIDFGILAFFYGGTLGLAYVSDLIVNSLAASEPFQTLNVKMFQDWIVLILCLLTSIGLGISFMLKITRVSEKWVLFQWLESVIQNVSIGLLGAWFTFILLSVGMGWLERQNNQNAAQPTNVVILSQEQEQYIADLIGDRLSLDSRQNESAVITETPEATAEP